MYTVYREDPRPRPADLPSNAIDSRCDLGEGAKKGQDYEYQFAKMWLEEYPDIDLHSQIRVSDQRLHKADFCHWPTKSLIEIDGGVWMGRSRSHGNSGDAEKSRITAYLGYSVYRFTHDEIKKMYKGGDRSALHLIAEGIRRRSSEI